MNYKFKVGDIIGTMEVINLSRKEIFRKKPKSDGKEFVKSYIMRCLECGWDKSEMVEGSIVRGGGCGCCSGNVVVKGINDLATVDNSLIKYFVKTEDAYTHTIKSNASVLMRCPYCDSKARKIKINNMVRNRSVACSCRDNNSYPERVMNSVLKQLKVQYDCQVKFEWSNRRVYDFVIEHNKIIIEVDGSQHYSNKGFGDLEKQRIIDSEKDTLAKENGYNLIRIDSRISEFNYIINNILNSDLKTHLDLESLNLQKVNEDSQTNIVFEVCKMWTEETSVRELCKVFKLNKTTMSSYLKKGAEIGWCNYSPLEESKKGTKKLNKTGRKVSVFKDGIFINTFDNSKRIEEMGLDTFGVKMSSSNIRLVCEGKRNHHQGYTFKYANTNE